MSSQVTLQVLENLVDRIYQHDQYIGELMMNALIDLKEANFPEEFALGGTE